MNEPVWIDTPHKLRQLIDELDSKAIIAVDTEGDSLYSYFEKVCLVQFSTPETDYLVDPLNTDISKLNTIFANESIQKIFHAAEYDILSLKRDYGFDFANLFDTMIAAKILGWPRYGLGSIIAEYFNIKLDKRYQRYNWGRRPLSREALRYARLDTHYLLTLRQLQLNELHQQNRLREASEAFERQTQLQPAPRMFDPNNFWRIKQAKDLKPQQQAVLRELYITRDKIARKIDRPPFKVVNDAALVRIALQLPHNQEVLEHIKGVSKNLVQHNAADILKAVKRGQNASPPQYHHINSRHRPNDETLNRYEHLRHWRNTIATERGVEPDVIISNGTLMHIARRNPKTLTALTKLKSLGDWQRETYGRDLLKVLQETS